MKTTLKPGYLCQWTTIIGSKQVRVVECGGVWERQCLVVDGDEKLGVASLDDLVIIEAKEAPALQFERKPEPVRYDLLADLKGNADEDIGRCRHI